MCGIQICTLKQNVSKFIYYFGIAVASESANVAHLYVDNQII